ncbi:MAG: GyrI-like domain-containing protein [Candidatus Krumholzibacteriota bacterium]|nr:GyrI-like domain-containing protein [Candidatus Krumholzibacteriota bacterium]
MSYEIEVRDVEPQAMVSIRTECHAAEIGATLQEILPEVWSYLQRAGVKPAGPPFTRYHGYVDNRADIEGGMPVAEALPGEGRITAGELPGGSVVTTIHMGPYEKLPEAHDALHVRMREQNKEAAGPQWEFYLTDPGLEPDPYKRKTELVWPIKDA